MTGAEGRDQPGGDCARCAATTHPFLSVLEPEELRRFAMGGRRVRKARGWVLCRQGEPAEDAWCVSGAVVKLTHRRDVDNGASAGRPTVVGVVGCGGLVGLSAVVSARVYPFTATVVVPGVVAEVPKALLDRLQRDNPAFTRSLLGELGREVEEGIRHAAILASPKLEPKLASILIRLAGGHAHFEAPCRVTVGQGLTRKDLAAMCGVSHEGVVRCLTKWKKQGLIETDGGPISLIQPAALAELRGG